MGEREFLLVRRDVFGRRAVVEHHPRRADKPTAALPDVPSALRFADELSRETGLPVIDETGGGHG